MIVETLFFVRRPKFNDELSRIGSASSEGGGWDRRNNDIISSAYATELKLLEDEADTDELFARSTSFK
jgi:hypothetical protein